MIEEGADESWVERGFVHGKKFMLLIWNLFGQVILMAYKSVLLGSLIAIAYEKPLFTSQEIADSGLVMYLPVEWYQYLYDTDPRESIRKIGENTVIYNYAGFLPKYVLQE